MFFDFATGKVALLEEEDLYYSHIPPWVRERNDMERARAIQTAANPLPQERIEKQKLLLKELLKKNNFFGRRVDFINNGRRYTGTVIRADVLTGRVTVEEEELGIAMYAWPSSLSFYSS